MTKSDFLSRAWRTIAFTGLLLISTALGAAESGATVWTATGSLATARSQHTATLLPIGKVLVAGGYNGGYLASAELYDPATGLWAATGSLITARTGHTETLLSDGKVLVVGGYNGGYLNGAELYDPATGLWTATGSLATARTGHTATRLPDGNVLVAGGEGSGGALASAELYDPATGAWTATGSLATARTGHTATLFTITSPALVFVLVAGGYNGSYLAGAELYDPATGAWTSAGSMTAARHSHTATLSGRILVAGGYNGSHPAGTEDHSYNPISGTSVWHDTGSLATGREHHTATLLPGSKILVAGGYNGSYLANAERYDPYVGGWTVTGSLTTARHSHTATFLPNGKVLAAGGEGNSGYLASAELFSDPADELWTGDTLFQGLNGAVFDIVSDNSGNLYVGGDFTTAGGVTVNHVARWNIGSKTWSALGSGTGQRVLALAVDGSGNLYAGGDFSTAGGNPANRIARWDGASWSALGSGTQGSVPDWPSGSGGVSALAVHNNSLYVGGYFTQAGDVITSGIARWDIGSSTWHSLGSGLNGCVWALAVDGSGNLYVGGDFSLAGGIPAFNIARWDTSSSSWGTVGLMGVDDWVFAVAVDGGNLYAGGNFTTAGLTVSANRIARWDGTNWSALGSGVSGVHALAADGSGNIYVGSSFSTAGGVIANNIARWDGTNWSALGSGTDGAVHALKMEDGNLYAGGEFGTAGRKFAHGIAVWSKREIQVEGNGNIIANNDLAPSLADHTDFGSADIAGGSVERTFTIRNLGTATLSLTLPVAVTGATADFSVTQAPNGTVAAGGATTFKVRFDPTAAGIRSATIRIVNNDLEENPYTFAIQGTGVEAPAITSPNNVTFVTGNPSSFNMTSTGTPTPALSQTGALPAGLAFTDNGDGTATLAGTPAIGTNGIYPIVITAANGVPPGATQNFTLTIAGPPAVSRINSVADTGDGQILEDEGTNVAITQLLAVFSKDMEHTDPVDANDVRNPANYRLTPDGLPDMVINNVTYDNNGGAGPFVATLQVNGGAALPNSRYTLTVRGVIEDVLGAPIGTDFVRHFTIGTAPAVTSGSSTTFMVSTAETFTVTATGNPTPALSAAGALPAGVAFTDNGNGTATLAGTPAIGTNGAYNIVITAANRVPPNATRNFTLTVNENPATDTDGDGLTDLEERGSDGSDADYDGNRDGIPDWKQDNVTSFHTNAPNGESHYITLAIPSGRHIEYVNLPGTFDATPPNGISFPYGFFSFSLAGVPAGGATTATICLDAAPPQTYYKYGKTPDNPTDHWYEFLYDGRTGAEVAGNIIVLHFVDGQRGDHDLEANGRITDPGGPAEIAPHAGLYFPCLVSTGLEKTEIGIINTKGYASTSTIAYYGENGDLIGTGTISLGPNGKATIPSANIPENSAGAIVSGDGDPVGYARYVNAQGKRCAWPAATSLQKSLSVPHTAVDGNWATAISLFNPNDGVAKITLTYESGATGAFTLNAKSRKLLRLTEDEAVVSIASTGYITAMEMFDSLAAGGDISALLLRERSLNALYVPSILFGSGEFTGIGLKSYYNGTVNITGHNAAGETEGLSFGTQPLGTQTPQSRMALNLSGLLGSGNLWAKISGEADFSTPVGTPLLHFQGVGVYGKENTGKLGAVSLNAMRFREGFIVIVSTAETAVALLNPGTAEAALTVIGYSAAGEALASSAMTIAAGSTWTGTAGDLLNGVSLADMTHVRIASDLDLYGFETIDTHDRIEMLPVMGRD